MLAVDSKNTGQLATNPPTSQATGGATAPGAPEAPARATPLTQPRRRPTAPRPSLRRTAESTQPTDPTPSAAAPPQTAEADARPGSTEATPGTRPARPNPPARQALVLEQALVPGSMATALGLTGELVGAAGYREYLDRLRKEAGNPTDPVEVMMLEQLAFAHLHAIHLQGLAGQAKGKEAVAQLNAAARLQNEFRKTALALKAYRGGRPSPRRRQEEPVKASPASSAEVPARPQEP